MVSPLDGPNRPPSLMALLIAAVSSVTPSPRYTLSATANPRRASAYLPTYSAIVLDVAENYVAVG